MPDLSYAVVEPPRVAPPRVGLLASAEEVVDGERWQTGFGFEPLACGALGGLHVAQCEATETLPTDYSVKAIADESRLVTYQPYTAFYGDTCSLALYRSRDFAGLASGAYVAAESALMARELWAGDAAVAGGLVNAYFSDGEADVVGGLWPVVNGLARLQQELADTMPGRGMIHAPKDVASLWYTAGVIRREGAVLLDAFDNIVVADAGYPGTGPNGEARTETTAYVFATDMVQVRRDGQVRILPSRDEAMGGGALDRDTNTVEWRAERIVAAYWSKCAQIALQVDVCAVDCPENGS